MMGLSLEKSKKLSIKIGLFLLAFGLLYALTQKSCSRETKATAPAEIIWVKSQVDMPANKEGIWYRDGSTMKCTITDTPELFLMTCKNQFGTEKFKLVKSDEQGEWYRLGSEKDPIGGKFSVSKVPNQEKYLGEVYAGNGTPAPFELTPQKE